MWLKEKFYSLSKSLKCVENCAKRLILLDARLK
jgi:hypothetical protein